MNKKLFTKKGDFPRQIFEECEFGINIIVLKRIGLSAKIYRAAYWRKVWKITS